MSVEYAECILPITEHTNPVFMLSANESDSSSKMSLSEPHPVNHFYAVTPGTRYPGTKQPMEQQASFADFKNETPMMPMQEALFCCSTKEKTMFRTNVAMEKIDISNSGKLIYSPKEIHYTRRRKYLPNYQPALPLCVTFGRISQTKSYHML